MSTASFLRAGTARSGRLCVNFPRCSDRYLNVVVEHQREWPGFVPPENCRSSIRTASRFRTIGSNLNYQARTGAIVHRVLASAFKESPAYGAAASAVEKMAETFPAAMAGYLLTRSGRSHLHYRIS